VHANTHIHTNADANKHTQRHKQTNTQKQSKIKNSQSMFAQSISDFYIFLNNKENKEEREIRVINRVSNGHE